VVEEKENALVMRIFVVGILLVANQLAVAVPQSYKQIAQQALMDGNRAKAIEYYEKWAEADPTDAISLYNLACCYALDSRTKDALSALAKSAEAGWSDSTHALTDPDLSSLHRSPEFVAALNKMASNARQRGEGYTSNVVKQERLGRYVVILPDEYDPARTYPLVVLLHGYGQSPEQFADVAKYINPREYVYIVPEGPYTALDSEGKGFSHLRELENYQEDAASVSTTADWIIRAADDAMKRYPIKGKKFYMIGFSQGAALAHITAALYPERIAGYAAHGGYIIKNTITEDQLAKEKKSGTRILITHGQDDPAVAAEEGIYASNMLKDAGLDVTFEMLPVAHVFSPDVGRRVGEWLSKISSP
jgi:predicted esterase